MKIKLVERLPPKPRLRDLAWLAGLYEGEGSCSIVRRYSNRPAARFHLASTDRDVVERAQRIAGMGSISSSQKPKGKFKRRPKRTYLWEVSRRAHVTRLILWLLPFACERRRARLEEAYAVMTAPMPCKFGGHILTAKNTGRWPGGSKKCLDCARIARARKIVLQQKRRAQTRLRRRS